MPERSDVRLELVKPGPALEARKDDIWSILEATDGDFVPALSSREPTTLGELRPTRVAFALPIEHLDLQLTMHVIFAVVGTKVVGYLSFLPNFSHDAVADLRDGILIDTIAVLPAWRRQGIARALYKAAFESSSFDEAEDVVLHTWSTNVRHGNLIDQLGFEEIRRIPNERAPGIDTLIYRRSARPSPFVDD